MSIRTLIVDDMLLARKRLRRHLEDDADIDVIGEASGGREAIELIQTLRPDLVFLDVQMPEIGGFEVLDAIGAADAPAVIFVTAYDQFALRAFEIHALDYLLKPFDPERLHKALARARRELQRTASGTTAGKLRALLVEMGGAKHARRLPIKADGRTVFLPVEDIDYIEAAGNYLRILTAGASGESHMIREKISDMEQRLDPSGFVRIHRSTIVNVDRIKEMHPLFNGDQTVVLRSGKRLTMSRTYRETVMKLLDRL
ncbi:MAG: response regulator [Acidobacteriota bacterium]|nr:response regulator [Acidobacteriota bacterium]